jgi:hypothetical protein
MVAVTIETGPVDHEDQMASVPRERWKELLIVRRCYIETRFDYDCRCLVQYVAEAEQFHQELGYESTDRMLEEELGLQPEWCHIALEWLRHERPAEPISAARLGEIGQQYAQMRLDQIEAAPGRRPYAPGGITQQQVAQEAGVSQQRVSQITSGTASKGTNGAQVKLSAGTDPAKAAARIREKLGSDFAAALCSALASTC